MRSSILEETVNQWLRMGFDVHVVSDCELELERDRVFVHVVSNPRHGVLGMPWEAIEKLKEIGSGYDIVAYAEDDIFVHSRAFDTWMLHKDRTDLNVTFYRVEKDHIHLTDGFKQDVGECVMVDGIPFAKMRNPYCAMWMMSARTFQEYCQSPWAAWESAQPISPWAIRETAAAGLTHAKNTVVVAATNVTHMYPPNGFDLSTHYTVEDLRKLLEQQQQQQQHGRRKEKKSVSNTAYFLPACVACAVSLLLFFLYRLYAIRLRRTR